MDPQYVKFSGLISGAIHYFRVVPEYWEDRLLKAKACGLNAVETYIPWNLHEPKPGSYRFEGLCNFEGFVRLAGELGLMVLLRPGPYICSEWDLGGLPSWLLADPDMRLRCSYPPFLAAVDQWFDILIPKLAQLQSSHGGPVIGFQVENEYGSFGNDANYLRHLAEGMRARGLSEAFFTSDGPSDSMLQAGTLPGVLKTANFGSNASEAFATLRRHESTGPLMCCEFWNGWFDHWSEAHHWREAQDATDALAEIFQKGDSVNFYMFHGGTSFGFMPGANCDGGRYQPTVNSYDSDAPLSENGELTPKFFAYQKLLATRSSVREVPLPKSIPKSSFGKVDFKESVALFEVVEQWGNRFESPTTLTMEELGQDYGFILYRTTVRGPRERNRLILQDVRDRAQIFVNGEFRGIIDRNMSESPIELELIEGDYQIDILVENMGRINFGPHLHDRKGITHGVRLGSQFIYSWCIFTLPMDDLSSLKFHPISTTKGPHFHRSVFTIDEPADTFLALPGWTKGVCWLNGFNLGRYWEIGPQRTLYVPGPLLKKGENELIVFELHATRTLSAEFRAHPDLG